MSGQSSWLCWRMRCWLPSQAMETRPLMAFDQIPIRPRHQGRAAEQKRHRNRIAANLLRNPSLLRLRSNFALSYLKNRASALDAAAASSQAHRRVVAPNRAHLHIAGHHTNPGDFIRECCGRHATRSVPPEYRVRCNWVDGIRTRT